jgi:phosphoribosylformimino-5-aminoimidazole carboxamide ribotide isomerase
VASVIGSESLANLAGYDRARQQAGPAAPLSLDFRGDQFIGPPELLDDATLWPQRVIVMTLARVGSGEGPDIARLQSIIARAGGREIYAAGGTRHGDDLRALRDIGAAGVLIASGLHQGTITATDVEDVAT